MMNKQSMRKFTAFNDDNGYRGMECSCGYSSTSADVFKDLKSLNEHECLEFRKDGKNLLPCPFCGGEAELGSVIEQGHFIKCRKCNARTRKLYWDYTPGKTIEQKEQILTKKLHTLWNTRS